MQVDLTAYKVFKDLKEKYSMMTIVITEDDFIASSLQFRDHRELVTAMFRHKGVEVHRFQHNYDTLKGSHPELGLVYLMNDSNIMPRMEVHALIGHNASYISEG